MDHNTTVKQIGTRNLMAAAARNFVSGANLLRFQITKVSAPRVKHVVEITLNSDAYDVTLTRIKGLDFSLVQKLAGVPAENLGAAVYGLSS